MIYLSCRLQRSDSINISEVIDLWKDLAQDIEPAGKSTWKVWRVTQVFSSEDGIHTRLYNADEENQHLKMVVKTSLCYLRAEQRNGGTTFTILSNEERALGSVRSLIANTCAPVEPVKLNESLSRNKSLLVQSVKLCNRDDDAEVSFTFNQPVTLGNLPVSKDYGTILSFTAIVNRENPPINILLSMDINVPLLYVNRINHQLGFSIETDLQDDDILIDRLFTMADRAFIG